MKKYNGWTGTNKEIMYLVDATLLDMESTYPELNEREIKALFCASLASNMVQNEIHDHMAWEFEQGEDGTESRNKLNELVAKYRIAE